jgi:TonB family protein
MRKLTLTMAIAALAAGAAVAQPNPVDQSKNWDTFMKLYPKRALAAGEQGLVAFKLTLDRNGHPSECQVTHSSGHKLLDNETCELLMMHAVFAPPKDADQNRVAVFRTEGVINWRLPGNESKLVSPVKLAKADPLDKKVCKRSVRTGTLAGFERTCMTVREWDRQRTEAMDAAAEFQGRKGFTTDPALAGEASTVWKTPQ